MDSLPSGPHPDAGHAAIDTSGQPARHPLRAFFRFIADGVRRSRTFVAGFLIGMSVWTPVFVATAAEETKWEQYGLPGGFALFTAGIWLRVGNFLRRRRGAHPRDPGNPAPGLGGFARN